MTTPRTLSENEVDELLKFFMTYHPTGEEIALSPTEVVTDQQKFINTVVTRIIGQRERKNKVYYSEVHLLNSFYRKIQKLD